jgi:hypothetical protein
METTCLNCGTVATGAYCPECGQRTDTGRLGPGRLWRDFLERVLLYDGVIRDTLWGLIRAPEAVCERYIGGERQKFVNPVKFFVGAMLAEAIFDPLYDWRLRTLLGVVERGDEVYDWRSVQIAAVFLTALIWHFFHLAEKYNFVENAVFCLFVASEALFVHVFLCLPPLALALPWIPATIAPLAEELTQALVLAGFFVNAGRRFYQSPTWKVALKTVFALTLAVFTVGSAVRVVEILVR